MVTLAVLLEELKEVDNYAYRRISMLVPCEGELEDVDNDQYDQDIVQGSIQRACERQEWHWTIMKDPYQDGYRAEIAVVSESHLSDHICIDDLAIKCATSPAEALLAAYIAAVREEAKR